MFWVVFVVLVCFGSFCFVLAGFNWFWVGLGVLLMFSCDVLSVWLVLVACCVFCYCFGVFNDGLCVLSSDVADLCVVLFDFCCF